MTQRLVLPRGAAVIFSGLIPRCDDPPTTALVLDAAPDVATGPLKKEAGNGKTGE